MKLALHLATAALAWCGAHDASADDDGQIVVTATRLRASGPGVAALTTITADDLARRQTTFVVDALAAAPGVAIAQNGGFGGQASVRIRGAASEQTLVLVDGIVVNDPSAPGGGWNAAFLDTADIARIEVLRGPQSTLWGADAIGGVVSIVTERAHEGLSVRAFGEGGAYGTLRGGAALMHGGERFDLRIGASGIGTNGTSKADKRDGNPEADAYDALTLDVHAGLDIASNLRVEAFGRSLDADNAYDSFGFVTGVTDGDELERTRERNYGAVGRLSLFGGRMENTVTLSHADITRRYFTDGAFSFGGKGKRETFRYQGDVRPSDAIDIVFGAEREDSEAEGVGRARIDSLFLTAELQPFEALTLSGGVRRDDHARFGEATTGRLGARLALSDGFGLRASWGQGFKAPSLFQLSFFFPPAPGPNLELQAEKAEGWDAAAFWRLLDGRLSGEIGYFHLDTEDLIQFTLAGRYENVARAKSEGIEASARFEVTPALTLSSNYTYTDAVDEATGLPLLRAPQHSGFAEIDWRPTDALGLTLSAVYNGEEAETAWPANPDGVNKAWARADLAARYRLSRQVDLYGRVQNLTDAHYQDVFGYGEPGHSAYVGVRVRIE